MDRRRNGWRQRQPQPPPSPLMATHSGCRWPPRPPPPPGVRSRPWRIWTRLLRLSRRARRFSRAAGPCSAAWGATKRRLRTSTRHGGSTRSTPRCEAPERRSFVLRDEPRRPIYSVDEVLRRFVACPRSHHERDQPWAHPTGVVGVARPVGAQVCLPDDDAAHRGEPRSPPEAKRFNAEAAGGAEDAEKRPSPSAAPPQRASAVILWCACHGRAADGFEGFDTKGTKDTKARFARWKSATVVGIGWARSAPSCASLPS